MLAFTHSTTRLTVRTARPLLSPVCAPQYRAVSFSPGFCRPWRRAPAMCEASTKAVSPPANDTNVPKAVQQTEGAPANDDEEIDPGVVEGTDLRIIRYPHPLLRAENATVEPDGFNDELKRIAREMLLVMYASRGVGLAAPQVGINLRLLVFNPEGDAKAFLQEVIMVNPTIIGTSKKTDVEQEACLSFPGMSGDVRRHEWIKVEAYRINGKRFRVKFDGWKARIFQHEFDHLDGVMYVDRLLDEDRVKVQGRLDELVKEYEVDPYEGKPPAL